MKFNHFHSFQYSLLHLQTKQKDLTIDSNKLEKIDDLYKSLLIKQEKELKYNQ